MLVTVCVYRLCALVLGFCVGLCVCVCVCLCVCRMAREWNYLIIGASTRVQVYAILYWIDVYWYRLILTWYVLPLAVLRTSESTAKREEHNTKVKERVIKPRCLSLFFHEFTVIFARTRKHVVRFNPTCFYVAAQWSEFVACKNWIRIRIILPWFVHIWYILEKRRGFTIISPDFGLFLSFLQAYGRVGFSSNERACSLESSLQSISSNSFLWKRTTFLVVIQTSSWQGKPAAIAQAGLRKADAECLHFTFLYEFGICS